MLWMRKEKIFYKAWLSIVSINIINLSMILFSIKSKLSPSLEAFRQESSDLMSTQRQNMGIEPSIYDLEAVFNNNVPKNQLEKIREKNIIRVAIVEKKAYWVHDNIFYQADVVNGYIDNNDAVPIDAHSLSQKELIKLLTILDSIKEK
jgi:hypothetical protein